MAGRLPDWIPTKKETPKKGERVLVCNDISEWVTPWKDGLLSSMCKHPVKYFVRYERPYPQQVAVEARLTASEIRERQMAERKRKA